MNHKINIKISLKCDCDYHLGLDLDNELLSWVCIVCGDIQPIG